MIFDAAVVGGSVGLWVAASHGADPAKARLREWAERTRQTRDERSVARHQRDMAVVGKVVERAGLGIER